MTGPTCIVSAELIPQVASAVGQRGSFIHTLWECPIIKQYWNIIIAELNEVLGETLPRDPKYTLLCYAWQRM